MWLEAATADSVDDILGRCVAYAWWVCIETEEPIPDDYLPIFFTWIHQQQIRSRVTQCGQPMNGDSLFLYIIITANRSDG